QRSLKAFSHCSINDVQPLKLSLLANPKNRPLVDSSSSVSGWILVLPPQSKRPHGTTWRKATGRSGANSLFLCIHGAKDDVRMDSFCIRVANRMHFQRPQ